MDSLNYDGWGRMLGWRHHRKTGATLTLLTTDSVWFDRTGNVHALGETRTYELQTDRLLTRSIAGDWSWTYSYDAAGNLTQAAGTKGQLSTTWTYGYDALNQLRSVRKDGTLVARYRYDVLGRRIARKVYAVTLPGSEVRETRYLYQGGHVGAETDAAGNIKWKYTWGPGTDNLIGLQDSTGTQYYVVQDQLGSVRGLVKRDGTWIMHQRFTPYGAFLARDSAGSSMPRGFHVGWTGREYDAETGFTFHRARYYSPDLRRWTQEDPIGYAGGGNLYAYVGGAVMEARDPTGLIEDISRWGPMGDGLGDPTIGVGGQDLIGGDTCLLFCTSARDRMQQEQDEFFQRAADVVIIITYADRSTREVTADPRVVDDVVHCFETSAVCGAQKEAMRGLERDFHYYFAEYGSLDVVGPSGRVANPGVVPHRPQVAGRTEIWLDPATARMMGVSMNHVIVHENWHALTHDPLTGAQPCDEACARTLTNAAGW